VVFAIFRSLHTTSSTIHSKIQAVVSVVAFPGLVPAKHGEILRASLEALAVFMLAAIWIARFAPAVKALQFVIVS
jgi:hypothetical protein